MKDDLMSSDPATVTSRLLWLAASAIIVIVAATCTVFCLLIRGPWWGKASACAGFTVCALYGWWLIWQSRHLPPTKQPV